MKNSKFVLILLILFLAPRLFAEAESCPVRVETHRVEQIEVLNRMQQSFRNSLSAYRQYQEILYNDLWSALQKKREKYSKTIQAEGEVLYARFRAEANLYKEKAEVSVQELQLDVKRLNKLELNYEKACFNPYPSGSPARPKFITSFENCMDAWNQETIDQYRKLKKVIRRYLKTQRNLSEKVEKFSKDVVSDHTTLDQRFAEDLQVIDGKLQSEFLKRMSAMRERFESLWPGDKCCARCAFDQEILFDPVLNALKPAPQNPQKGVTGKRVNSVDLSEAVDQMVDREKRRSEIN